MGKILFATCKIFKTSESKCNSTRHSKNDEKLEQKFDITPTIRNKLLKEIREEEEREAKEENQFWWKNFKAKLKIGTAVTAFVVSIFFKRDIFSAAGIATLSAMTVSTITDVVEVKKDMAGDDEEIKLPPLRNLPELPKNYTRVDVYSYGL